MKSAKLKGIAQEESFLFVAAPLLVLLESDWSHIKCDEYSEILWYFIGFYRMDIKVESENRSSFRNT